MKSLFSFLLLSALGFAQVEGPWTGTLKLPTAKLRSVWHLARDGAVDFTTVTQDAVSIDIQKLQANDKGRLSADGQSMTGTFTQAGNSFPHEFKKTTLQAHAALHKNGRPLTGGCQMIAMLAARTERRLLQLQEVETDAKFPEQ
jgi:hypothetical protein